MRLQLRPVAWLLLPIGLASGCFQPLDPYEPPEYGEEAPRHPTGQDGAAPLPGTPSAGSPRPPPGAPAPAMDAGANSAIPAPPNVLPPLPIPGLPTPPPALLDAGSPDPCRDLPPTRCAQTQGCFSIRFYAFDYDHNCSNSETRPACVRFPCGLFGTTLARDPRGQAFTVPVGCVPSDFTPLSRPSATQGPACPTAAASAACARHRDEASCAGDLDYQCAITTAQSYDPVKQCIGDQAETPRFLSCMAWQTVKDGPSRYFRDAQGKVWRVPPEGFDAVPSDWLPIAASSVLPDAGAELPICFKPLI